MTPTAQAAIDRHRRFHERIAQKAAELELRKPPPPAAPDPDPPSPETDLFKQWMDQWNSHPTRTGWFSISEEIQPSFPSIALIVRIVCQYYNVPKNGLLSARRTANLVRPRQVGMYLAKEFTKRSLPEIGRRFGGRDHTTVLHAVRVIGLRKETDPDLAAEIEMLRTEIRVAT